MAVPMFVSPCRVQRLLQDKPLSVQLVDCRSFLQYSTDTVLTAVNVYCPPLLKKRFSQCIPLETVLAKDTRDCLLRPGLETVVLFDEDTDEVTSSDNSTDLQLIYNSLHLFLGNKNYIFLSGGFLRFRQECPHLCTSQAFTDITMRITIQRTPPSPSRQTDSSGHTLGLRNGKTAAPVELLPYLYIGDASHSCRKDLLQSLSITAILNVSTSCENHFPHDFRYKIIPVEDTGSADLMKWFREAIEFIESERKTGGRVLVHCRGGVSRSATVCLAYLMYSRSLCLDDAFEYVKSRRDVISPNINFMMQLSQFERQVATQKLTDVVKSPPSPMSPCRLYSQTFPQDLSISFPQCNSDSDSAEVDIAHVPTSFHFVNSVVTTS